MNGVLFGKKADGLIENIRWLKRFEDQVRCDRQELERELRWFSESNWELAQAYMFARGEDVSELWDLCASLIEDTGVDDE